MPLSYETSAQDKVWRTDLVFTQAECPAPYVWYPDGGCTSTAVADGNKAMAMCDQLPGCQAADYNPTTKEASFKKAADRLEDQAGWVGYRKKSMVVPIVLGVVVVLGVAIFGGALMIHRRRVARAAA